MGGKLHESILVIGECQTGCSQRREVDVINVGLKLARNPMRLLVKAVRSKERLVLWLSCGVAPCRG